MMNWFNKIKLRFNTAPIRKLTVITPISGQITSLESVPDAIFAQKIIGDGLAIEPSSDIMLAPIDGRITKIYPNNHAFVIQSSDGINVVSHFGINSIYLRGRGFKQLTSESADVQAGDPIIECDIEAIRPNLKSFITPVVISAEPHVNIISIRKQTGHVKAGINPILTLEYSIKNK